MDFWQTVVVLFRRWYISVPSFVAALGLAGATYSAVPAQYESHCVLVLTTPSTASTGTAQTTLPNSRSNPLLNFDHDLSLTAAIVIQQMNSSETATLLGLTPGGRTGYLVTNGSTNPELLESGPFIFIVGTGASPQEAADIADEVADRAIEVLVQQQRDLQAPRATHINAHRVVQATPGRRLTGHPLRAAAAAGALAAIASLVAAYGFESYMQHRSLGRQAERREQEDR